MYKGYKVRLYPTKEQEAALWKHVHACRFLWNYMLAYHTKHYEETKEYLNSYAMIYMLPKLKQQEEFKWLNEVSNTSLQRICRDLNQAFQYFFTKKVKYPKFKSRKTARKIFPIDTMYCHPNKKDNTYTVLRVGRVKVKPDVFPEGKMINQRIAFENGKWILSFEMERENQAFPVLTDKSMGIDLGIKELAVVSFGDEKIVFHNINKSKRVRTLEHKLKHLQRVLNRKYRTNKSYEKTKAILKYEAMIKEIYYKLKNIRKNYIHQVTHRLVAMLPKRVVMENINILDLLKNKHKARLISQQYWSLFVVCMQYKCEWNGIEFIQADRWYPSSKMCSCCGSVKKDLKLSDRVFNCDCGAKIDRDYNAAINLMRYMPQT